jgi:HlyD family secretion protein
VDESDIGQIAMGQPVRFTVQAFPNRTFEGTVRQVRLQSTTTSNVVSYTVVVAVDNLDGALLPGMTATVNFQVAKATAVLRVANAALRFRPSTEMAAAIQAARRASGDTTAAGARPDSAARAAWRAGAAAGGTAGTPGASGSGGGPATTGAARGSTAAAGGQSRRPIATSLYYLDAAGKPQVARVRTGLSDGQFTEVTGPALREGMQIIAGLNTAGSAAAATPAASANPFQQNQQRQGAGGPRPGGM